MRNRQGRRVHHGGKREFLLAVLRDGIRKEWCTKGEAKFASNTGNGGRRATMCDLKVIWLVWLNAHR